MLECMHEQQVSIKNEEYVLLEQWTRVILPVR
jgi:hypothetical protein